MNQNELNQFIHDNKLTPKQAQYLAASFKLDPSTAFTISCEGPNCTNEFTLADSHSFVVVYATTGNTRNPSFQCDQEQHYGCSPTCAILAAKKCMEEHLVPNNIVEENSDNTETTME